MYIESTMSLPNSQDIFVRVRTGDYGENLILLWATYRSGQLAISHTGPVGENPVTDAIGQPVSDDDVQKILFLLQQRMADALRSSEVAAKERMEKLEKSFTVSSTKSSVSE